MNWTLIFFVYFHDNGCSIYNVNIFLTHTFYLCRFLLNYANKKKLHFPFLYHVAQFRGPNQDGTISFNSKSYFLKVGQSAGAVEYTNCFSAER